MSRRDPLVFAQLHLPRPLAPEAVEALLNRLASDPTSAPIVLEARAAAGTDRTEVTHWIGTTAKHARWLQRTLHDLLPGVVVNGDVVCRRRSKTGRFRRLKSERFSAVYDSSSLAAVRMLGRLSIPRPRSR